LVGMEHRQRAGGRALSLFVAPLTLPIVRALGARPMRLAELRQWVGLPAQTTLRGHLADLTEVGAIVKRAHPETRYAVDFELTPMGRDLLEVAGTLDAWLGLAPGGSMRLGSGTAKGAVRALVDGWCSEMICALAARSLSLTELDRGISDLNYPALERRLVNMRMAGLIESNRAAGARTPYLVTDWGRRAVMPLARAARCERLHMTNQTKEPAPVDIEAAFLLAVPLAVLPDGAEGRCEVRVESGRGPVPPIVVQVEIERGRVVSCVSRLERRPRSWAAGSAGRWFEAINEGDPTQLRLGGGGGLAVSLVRGLHAALAAGRVPLGAAS
jgi:DNA-binding HxlR family transcriptional regulator